VAAIKAALPSINVLVLTVYDDADRVFEALRAGASGYLLKADHIPTILRGIDEVVAGGAPLNSQIARMILTTFSAVRPATPEIDLTERQVGIFGKLAKLDASLKPGDRVVFGTQWDFALTFDGLEAEVVAKGDDGLVTLRFARSGPDLDDAIRQIGVMPLPPYIADRRAEDDRDRSDYQTVYAAHDGSVAAPTAGLHFTPELLDAIRAKGVSTHAVTLHVGAGTFLPVKVDDLADHRMHAEWGTVSQNIADALNAVRASGGRIVCVGTTSLRLLESATGEDGVIRPFHDDTAIFITPVSHSPWLERPP
jgi:S-adenosylmethionine:tRNA ribosyltransferase-isomerase